jgi:hypothetical protein
MSDQDTRDRRKRKRDFRKKRPRAHRQGRHPQESAHVRGDNVFHDPSDPYEPLDFHDEQE